MIDDKEKLLSDDAKEDVSKEIEKLSKHDIKKIITDISKAQQNKRNFVNAIGSEHDKEQGFVEKAKAKSDKSKDSERGA